MFEDDFHEGETEQDDSSANKVMVDPGRPEMLTWQRNLSTPEITRSEFTLSFQEMKQMAAVGLRLWRHIQEEAAKGIGPIMNPFAKRAITFSHGVPLGGVGAGSIGRSYKGQFLRWQLFPRICESAPVLANQFSVSSMI